MQKEYAPKCASSLKKQSVSSHVAPIGHIILIPSKPDFILTINVACFAMEQQMPMSVTKYQFFSL